MWRWISNIAAALSALLCLTVAVLWVRSYLARDNLDLVFPSGEVRCLSWGKGQIGVGATLIIDIDSIPDHVTLETSTQPANVLVMPDSFWTEMGISIRLSRYPPLIVPMWFVVLPTLILPLYRFWNWLNARRINSLARCRICRYDLTGNLSGTCPECGTAIELQTVPL